MKNSTFKILAAGALALACAIPAATAHADPARPATQDTAHSAASEQLPGWSLEASGMIVEQPAQSLQVVDYAAMPAVTRDTYTVTAPPPPPKPAAVAMVSKWIGGPAPAQAFSGAAVVAYAQQFVGVVPYGTGNNPAESFSCDGLVQYVFGQFGISLPRTVGLQAARGVQISASQAQPGDLVVWPGQHIGIFAGGGTMVDSPKPGMFVQHRGIWGGASYFRLA